MADQLTLDDWVENLNADRATASVPEPAGTRADPSALGLPAEPPDGAVRPARAPTHAAVLKSAAADLLGRPDALLTRTHLRELGLERRAIDAVFRALPVVAIPGYSRPLIRAVDYIDLIEQNTFHDDRVRPT